MSAAVITLVGGPTALVKSWAYFTRNAEDLVKFFTAVGIGPRLKTLEGGVPTRIDPR